MDPSASSSAYAPPKRAGGRPVVILWLRIYAVMTLVVYGSLLALWMRLTQLHAMHDWGAELAGSATLWCVGISALLVGGVFAVTAMVPYKPWGWTVALIAICLGLFGFMALAAIPLLVFWLKPETKAAFGRL